MSINVKRTGIDALGEQKREIRKAVLAGYHQIQEGKYKDFHAVCDRLEKELQNAAVHN